MGPAHKLALVSEKEFLSGPESTDHVELIDGEVIVAPGPTWTHHRLTTGLYQALEVWAEAHPPAAVGLAPLDVRLGPGRIVQPDVFVVLGGVSGRMPIDSVPDLIIEVVSQNRTHDRITKKLLYAEAGVKEYWLVEPATKTTEIYKGLKRMVSSKTTVTSRVLKGFTVDLKKLFAR